MTVMFQNNNRTPAMMTHTKADSRHKKTQAFTHDFHSNRPAFARGTTPTMRHFSPLPTPWP